MLPAMNGAVTLSIQCLDRTSMRYLLMVSVDSPMDKNSYHDNLWQIGTCSLDTLSILDSVFSVSVWFYSLSPPSIDKPKSNKSEKANNNNCHSVD